MQAVNRGAALRPLTLARATRCGGPGRARRDRARGEIATYVASASAPAAAAALLDVGPRPASHLVRGGPPVTPLFGGAHRSARGPRRFSAVLTSDTCENACGKVADQAPRAATSYSSESSPTSLQRPTRRSKSARGLAAAAHAAPSCRRARSCTGGRRPRPRAGRRRAGRSRSAARSRPRAGALSIARPCRERADRPAAGSRRAGS